jgi:hypothetical protein
MMQTASVPPPLERHAMPEPKHSGLGIASFVMGLIFGLILFVLIGIAGVQEVSNPGGMDENSPFAMVLGLLLLGALLMNLVGAALGLAGVLQKNRRKIFAVLGLVFNLLAVLGTGSLMVLGMMME